MIAEIIALFNRASGVAVDSRKVKRGELFFALKGNHFDGHDFLGEVATQGALAAIVNKGTPRAPLPLIEVPDVLATLQEMARHVQQERKNRVIAITGSVAKSTTKEFISQLLEKKFQVRKTPGNANSQIGFPLSILNDKTAGEVFVAEMGMDGRGQIAKLLHIAPPEIAVLTYIGHAHLAYFPDGQKGIAEEKAQIFSHPGTRMAILNRQALSFPCIREKIGCAQRSFSLSCDEADYSLKRSDRGWIFQEGRAKSPPFSLPFQSSHLLENLLCATAVVRQFDLSWQEIIDRLGTLKPLPLRFEPIEREGVFFINDCYNSSPEAMKAALDNLPQPNQGGRKIALLGGMAALGSDSAKWHRELAIHALEAIDLVLCYGQESHVMFSLFQERGREGYFFDDFEELRKGLFQLIRPRDVVLIKGKNSDQLWRLLEDQ